MSADGGTRRAGRTGRVVRRPGDALALVAALVVALAGAGAARAWGLTAGEQGLFRSINDLPGGASGLAQGIDRLGTLWAAGWVVVGCLAVRAWRAGLAVVAACWIVTLVNRWAKEAVARGRPADLLHEVHLRGPIPDGPGYPSGHTATAAAVAAALAPHVPPWARPVLVVVVVLVALCRTYVGAHLPLDVLGGAAVGLAVGSAVHVALGVRAVDDEEREPAEALPG